MAAMGSMGTLSWVEQTSGKTAWTDRLTLLAQGVRARIATNRRLRSHVKLRNVEVRDILPPDSATAREAVAIAQACSSEALFHHSLRAYFWARLLDADRRAYDDEAMFVAVMLHDLGLTERHRLSGDREQCFTIVGARATAELGRQHGWPDQRIRLAANAITLHLNVIVGDEHGKEAQMVRAGSGGDVAGLGLDVLHRDQIDEVNGRYPRLGFKQEVIAALEVEACERPCCRTAFLCGKLGFTELIRRNRTAGESPDR